MENIPEPAQKGNQNMVKNTPLDQLLTLVEAHDLYVFPIEPGGKQPLVKWSRDSTNDPDQIRRWHSQWPDCNWGLDCGKSGLLALDIDVKEGKTGDLSLLDLQQRHGPLPSVTNHTPTGGNHIIMRCPPGQPVPRTTSEHLGPGLDTRGAGGYVVLVGQVGGRPYTWAHGEAELPMLPDWLGALIGERRAPVEQIPVVDLDHSLSIAQAVQYLQTTAPAVEKQRGDSRTVDVAGKLKDFGISEPLALDLMLEYYNPRCLPPWDADELQRKIHSGYTYLVEHRPGQLSPAVMIPDEFEEQQIEAMAQRLVEAAAGGLQPLSQDAEEASFLSFAEMTSQPPTASWLVKGYLDRNSFGMIFGDPASMKSFLAIDLGVSLAAGLPDWHGHLIKAAGPVFYICGEGRAGIGKRLRVRKNALPDEIDKEQVPFFTSTAPVHGTEADSVAAMIKKIEKLATKHGTPLLVIVDTLARNFGTGDENSQKDMGLFIRNMDALRTRLNCTVLLIHHSGLADKNRGRGASALRAALDWEYKVEGKDEEPRTFTNTKPKDYEAPPALTFRKEVVATGWNDDDGEAITSVVLHLADTPARTAKTSPDKAKLSARLQIALRALEQASSEAAFEGRDPDMIPHKVWKEKAYAAGFAFECENESSRATAFRRAARDLNAAGHVLPVGADGKAFRLPKITPFEEDLEDF